MSRRPLAIPCVLLLSLPSCFTMQVWQEPPRANATVYVGELWLARADEPAAFTIQVPVDRLPREWQTGHGRPDEATWLLLRPSTNEGGAAQLLGMAADGRLAGVGANLELFDGDEPAARLSLTAAIGDDHPLDFVPAPGVDVDAIHLWIALESDCTVAWSETALQPARAARVAAHASILRGGHTVLGVAGRALLTPLAVVADVVTFPYQLFWGLVFLTTQGA